MSRDPLQNIARGTTIVFLGVVATLALNFLVRVALTRYVTEDEYGLYSLAVTLAGMVSAVAMLGLDEGAARHIAFFTGRSDRSRAGGIITASLRIALASSLAFAALLFLGSDAVAAYVFHAPALAGPLRIVAASVPLTAMLQMLTSVMRGLNDPGARAFFKDTLRPLLFLALLAGIMLLRLPLEAVIAAYAVSMALALAALALYTASAGLPRQDQREPVARDLMAFSLPLLSVNLLMLLMSQATMLILGYFREPADVGRYDLAVTTASLLLIVINSLGYIYTPTATGLYGRGLSGELRQCYQASTKWGYVLTAPVLCALLIFAAPLVGLLYGAQYLDIVPVLQIITLGYLVNPITGPNYHTLIAAGRMRAIIESFLLNAASNVVLCLVLIPPYGLAGAAVAAALSSTCGNVLLSVRLFRQLGIHPLTRSYVLSVASSIAFIALLYLFLRFTAIGPSLLTAPAFLALYVTAYAASLLVLHAIDADDLRVLAAVERKIGLKVTPLLARYVE